LAHRRRIQAERGDIPTEARCLQNACSRRGGRRRTDGTTYAARWRSLTEFSTPAKLAPDGLLDLIQKSPEPSLGHRSATIGERLWIKVRSLPTGG
jgi:hypothetical protein